MRMLFRVLLLSCALFSANLSAGDNFDLHWMKLTGQIELDPPERLLASSYEDVQLGKTRYRPVFSEVNGLIYMGLYPDKNFLRLRRAYKVGPRAYKLGPLPLFSSEQYDRLTRCGINNWASSQALDNQLHLLTFDINCQGVTHSHFLLIDGSTDGEPRLAVGHVADDQVHLLPLQPLAAERREFWQRTLTAHGERNRLLEWTSINLLPSPPPVDAVEELRRLHAEAFRHKGTPPSLLPLRELLIRHDYRQLGRHEADVPRLLNDTAFWLSEAGRLAEARPLLLEVLRRDPQRTPAYLNLADLDWRLHKQQPYDARHPARAQEHYRMYCSLRLAGGQPVPRRVLENLQLPEASASECRPHWPLLDAVRTGDLAKVRTLLQAGIPGEVVGDEGYSALLLALHTPEPEIAELLIAHGARLDGEYVFDTLAGHALRLDRQHNSLFSRWPRVRFLARHGNALETTNRGETLLMRLTADSRASDAFDEVLRHTRNLDAIDGKERTALHLASEAQNFHAVSALLAAGANPNLLSNGRQVCSNGRGARYTAIQLFARELRFDPDAATRRASRDSFAQLLRHGSNLAAGHQCELTGHDVLLESLIHKQRADLIRLLADYGPLPPPAPALLERARKEHRDAVSEQDVAQTREVLDVLLALGESPDSESAH